MDNKVCFITLTNLFAVPYLSKYTELINCKYDVIYWNRCGEKENSGADVLYPMNYKIDRDCGKLSKLIGYLKFRKFATQLLKKKNYKAVVLLSGNVAVLLKPILLSKYKGRYIIDIRDYFKEYNKLYYNKEKEVVRNSKLAVISSAAYKTFLPQYDYVVVHNSPTISEESLLEFKTKRKEYLASRREYPLVLTFVGSVRFFEQDKKVLRYFGNDKRFFVRYFGIGANILKQFCKEHNIHNTYFHDRFPPEKTLDFYTNTDFIINLYGSGTPLLDYALSNKLYYAATLGIPILVCPGTYMEKVAVGNGFGFTVDFSDNNTKEKLITYFRSIRHDSFVKQCNEYMKTVDVENHKWSKTVFKALK